MGAGQGQWPCVTGRMSVAGQRLQPEKQASAMNTLGCATTPKLRAGEYRSAKQGIFRSDTLEFGSVTPSTAPPCAPTSEPGTVVA